MKIRCKILNDLDEYILADVSVLYKDKQTKLHYNEQESVYELETELKNSDLVTFEVRKKGYATLSVNTEVQDEVYIFKISQEDDTVYIRQGKIRYPIKKHDGIYQIIGYGKEFDDFINSMGLVKLDEYNGTKLEYSTFYIKNPYINSDKNQKQLTNEFASNLGELRNSRLVESAGPIYVLKDGTIGHYSGHIKIKFKQGISSSKTQAILKDVGCQLIQVNSLNEHIVSARSKGGYDELIDCIETIYNSGDVEYILPLVFINPKVDMIAGNLLSKGQYTHKVIEVREAWNLLKTHLGIAYTFGKGDVIVCICDSGLYAEGGVQNPSFTGMVTLSNGNTSPKIPNVNGLQDFRPGSFGSNNDTIAIAPNDPEGSHGVKTAGIFSASAIDGPMGFGIAGVAPNTQLVSIISRLVLQDNIVKTYTWASGLTGYSDGSNHLNRTTVGFDVFVCSTLYEYISNEDPDNPASPKDHMKLAVQNILRYGRTGRGSIMLFSAGNDNIYVSYQPPTSGGGEKTNRHSVYPGVLSIGATGFYEDYPGERKTRYSNSGKIDFCAPSNNSGGAYGTHNPISNMGTWTTTLKGKGDLPGEINLVNLSHEVRTIVSDVTPSNAVVDADASVSGVYPVTIPLPFQNPTEVINPGDTVIKVASTSNFSSGMIIKIGYNEFVLLSSVNATELHIDYNTPIMNTYSDLSNTEIIGFLTINVANHLQYSIGEYIDLESISQGRTTIYPSPTAYPNSFRIEHIITGKIAIDNPNSVVFENGKSLKIRRSVKMSNGHFQNNFPSNYNPSGQPSEDIDSSENTISILDATNYLPGSMLLIATTGGNSEWVVVGASIPPPEGSPPGTPGTITVDYFTPLQHNHPASTTEVRAYPTLLIFSEHINLSPGDKAVIQKSPHPIYVTYRGKLNEYVAFDPIPTAIHTGPGNLFKAIAIEVDNLSGTSFAPGNKLLIEKPEFEYDGTNNSSINERSEIVQVSHIEPLENKIFVERILKDHNVSTGNSIKIYKGEYDYTSSFGGTSSACPTVGGVIGLMLSANPDLTWVEIVDILRKTSDKIDPDCRGYELPINDNLPYNVSSGATPTRPEGVGRWKNKACEYILNVDGTPNPAVTDTEPYYSEWYGYGRVNAKKAVQGALNYNESQRDLMIRDTLTDEGATDNIGTIHSPDIWVQHTEVDYLNDSTKPDFSKAPPHENPKPDSDRYIYARVKNKGELYNNLECTVRFYIALCDGTNATGIDSPFLFPDDWLGDTELSEITSNAGTKQTYFVGEEKIKPDKITPGGGDDFYNNDDSNQIVSIKWNEVDIPSSATNLKTYLLVQVSPHDGSRNGLGAESNSNLSFREIVFADFQFKKLDGGSLPNEIEVDELGTETSDFEVEVKTPIGNFITEDVEIIIERHNANGVVDNATFKYNSTNSTWELKDGDGATSSWSTMSAPVEIGTSEPASGVQTEIKFSGSYSVDKQFSKVRIKAIINSSSPTSLIDIPVGEGIHDVAVYEATLNPEGLIPSSGQPPLYPQSYTFTDFAEINPQNASEAFGPKPSDETNKFRVTSSFTAATDVNAYAITSGFVMIQPGSAADRVNLILRPFTQPIPGLTNVKYIIYRELRLDEFLNTGDLTKVVTENTSTNSEWITELYNIHSDLNNTGDFLSKALGYDPGNQAAASLIDDYFFSTDPDFQLPFVGRGTQFGKFFASGGSNAFGIDIILDDKKFVPDLSYARTAYHEIDVTGLPTSNDAEKFTKRLKQDEVLNFMDLATFYGIHFTDKGRVQRRDGSGNTEKIPLANLYADVIEKFTTRNTVYIDIRNEFGDSLNFFTNYDDGSNNQLEYGIDSGTLTAESYATHSWPLLIKDNSTSPVNSTEDFNELYLKLRIDDNIKPLLFVRHGKLSTSSVKSKFVEGDHLYNGSDPWTNEIGFTYPNTGSSGAKLNIAWMLKLHYSRQIDSNTVWPSKVMQTNYHADNLFGSIDSEQPWESDNDTQWDTLAANHYVDGESFGFGQVAEKGHAVDKSQATDRVILYATSTDSFNSVEKFSPNNGQTSGTSEEESFFGVPMVFSGHQLEFDIINSSPNITTLNFTQNPDNPILEQNTQVLGLTKDQIDTLKALSGTDNRYPRSISFDKLGDFTDINGKPYSKFKIGIQGLDLSGDFLKVFPATDIEVYSRDELFFTSETFSSLELFPLFYRPTVEERNGTRLRHSAKKLNIDAIDSTNKKITVIGKDAKDLVKNEKVEIAGSTSNDGLYTVVSALPTGTDKTIIEVIETVASPGASLGTLSYEELEWQDYFIRLDQSTTISSPSDKMEVIVQNFINAVDAVANDDSAPSLIEGYLDTYAPMILLRARAIVNENFNSTPNPDDRILYWARLKMTVAIKKHPYIRKSSSDRNNLVSKLENLSRGYSSVDFSGLGSSTKKILITGYDPFFLQVKKHHKRHNILQSNPSGAAALYLHDKVSAELGTDAKIQTVLFPVRFDDFDDGVIDRFFDEYVKNNNIDMIITLSQGRNDASGDGRYDLERFATKYRSKKIVDNENKKRKKQRLYEPDPADPINGDLLLSQDPDNLPETLETNLPSNAIISTLPSQYTLKQGNEIYNQGWFEESGNINKDFRFYSSPGDSNSNTPPSPPADKVIEVGSGGNYLSNEIFYRVALLREKRNSTVITGHLHLPVLQPSNGDTNYENKVDFDKIKTKEMIEDVIQMVVDGINAL